jgi:hypothetical protein
MFFKEPDEFDDIISRLTAAQEKINSTNLSTDDMRFACSGAYIQAIAIHNGQALYSQLWLQENKHQAIIELKEKLKL